MIRAQITLFSSQVPVVSTQAPEFFVQVSPSVTPSGLLVEGVYLKFVKELLSSLTLFLWLPLIPSRALPAR